MLVVLAAPDAPQPPARRRCTQLDGRLLINAIFGVLTGAPARASFERVKFETAFIADLKQAALDQSAEAMLRRAAAPTQFAVGQVHDVVLCKPRVLAHEF